jgi:hypothetical protein
MRNQEIDLSLLNTANFTPKASFTAFAQGTPDKHFANTNVNLGGSYKLSPETEVSAGLAGHMTRIQDKAHNFSMTDKGFDEVNAAVMNKKFGDFKAKYGIGDRNKGNWSVEWSKRF